MQTALTYKTVTLLDGCNVLELQPGTKPSFGVFFCAQEDYTALSTDSNTPGDLVFGASTDDDKVTWKNFYLVKAELISRLGAYKIVLADRRIMWAHTFGTKDYNTYLSQTMSGDEYELENTNTDAGANWTYQTLLNDLNIQAGLTVPGSPTREPRNIRGIGQSYQQILQQLMFELNAYLLYDPFADTFSIKLLSEYDATGVPASNTILFDSTIMAQDLWKPLHVLGYYSVIDTGNYDSKSADVSGGVIGDRAVITSYTDSTNGKAYTQEFVTQLAGAYGVAPSWSDQTYPNILKLAPTSAMQYITWTISDALTTRIRRGFPFEQPAQIRSSLFAANGFVKTGGANLPTGEFQHQSYYMVTQDQAGWSFVRAHGLPT